MARSHGPASAFETACGFIPRYDDSNLAGLELTHEDFNRLTAVDPERLLQEAKTHDPLIAPVADRLPPEFAEQRDLLRLGLERAAKAPGATSSILPRPVGPHAA